MAVTIALCGNPNSGKTTLFNQLTGNHQYVGNWPGVTVERKSGTLKGDKEVEVVDLPGIYSLSPYTNEEVVSRNFLTEGDPDVIIDVVDASNLERNLYLATQLMEFGVPLVLALNQMDIVKKRGYEIKSKELSEQLHVPVVEISALHGDGVEDLTKVAIDAAKGSAPIPVKFAQEVEKYLAEIESKLPGDVKDDLKRWYAIKVFERDEKAIEDLSSAPNASETIIAAEAEFNDKSDAIITNERFKYITSFIGSVQRRTIKGLTTSEKIDSIVTNRILALPIFVIIIAFVYYIAISTVGTYATDWANDGVFGDGWFLDPVAIVYPDGSAQARYDEAAEPYDEATTAINEYIAAAEADGVDIDDLADAYSEEDESYDFSDGADSSALKAFESEAAAKGVLAEYKSVDEEEVLETDYVVYCGDANEGAAQERADELNEEYEAAGRADVCEAVIYNFDGETTDEETGEEVPQGIQVPAPGDYSEYGIWIPGIPVLAEAGLAAISAPDWLNDLLLNGIIAGVGAVLGFVPQIMVLFFLLAILEGCGYMARVTFILDRIFRRFGLSGKTFIPMLIGTGCGIPGIMASRTIESESSRKLTVMTTTFMPCSAKLPIVALISTAFFNGAWWVAPVAYFLGIASIIISGIMLKKTKPFIGETTPYIMELPEYRLPRFVDLLRSMWERAWAFIKKAGTIILLATIIVWFLSGYGWEDGAFGAVEDMNNSILAVIGGAVAWIFAPLGFGSWEAASGALTGLLAKENLVGTMAVLYASDPDVVWTTAMLQGFNELTGGFGLCAAFSYLVFNLLCAPCFAAMGAIKREMGGFNKWFWAAVGYECGYAWCVALMFYNFSRVATGGGIDFWFFVAVIIAVFMLFMLFRPYPKEKVPETKATAAAAA